MVYVALGLAVLACLIALAALAKAAHAARELEDARSEARRSASNVREELEEQLATTRKLLALISEGARPTRDMILEGQLWRDVDGAEAGRMQTEGGLRIVDVRTPQETAGGVIPGAILIPIDLLEQRAAELPRDGKRTLIYCAGGGRSAAACEFLSAQGFREVYNLAGGIGTWKGPLQKA